MLNNFDKKKVDLFNKKEPVNKACGFNAKVQKILDTISVSGVMGAMAGGLMFGQTGNIPAALATTAIVATGITAYSFRKNIKKLIKPIKDAIKNAAKMPMGNPMTGKADAYTIKQMKDAAKNR